MNWVKRNIAFFGGDKNNVTIGGQSAGGRRHRPRMVSPLSAGLFHRGICESFCPRYFRRRLGDRAEATGIAFSVAAGCGPGTDASTAKCLRKLTSAQVEALAGTESAASQYVRWAMHGSAQSCPHNQPITLHDGQFIHVPLMNGDAEDEKNFSLGITEYFSGPPRVPPTAAQYLNFVNTSYAPPTLSGGNGGEGSGQLSAQRLCEPATGLG